MEQQGVLIAIVDHCHTEDTDRGAEILDVECGRKGKLELSRPLKVAAENQDVININCYEHNQGGGDQRIASAITF